MKTQEKRLNTITSSKLGNNTGNGIKDARSQVTQYKSLNEEQFMLICLEKELKLKEMSLLNRCLEIKNLEMLAKERATKYL